MRSLFTAIVASLEAAAVALVGLVIVVLPAALLWILTFELAAEPSAVFGSAIGAWFLAHLVPLRYELSSQTAAGLGLPQQSLEFVISLVPLAITVLTVGYAVRSGWRLGARGGAGAGAALGGMIGFGAIAALVEPVSRGVLIWPIWAAILVPAVVYGAACCAGFLVRAVHDEHPWWMTTRRALLRGVERLKLPGAAALPDRAALTVKLAVAAVASLIGLAALGVAASIVAGYVQVTALSQALQLDALGAFVIFLLQLAYLPVFVIWSASWFAGTGFSLGEGSSVTPFETLLGPVPALPMFGAIPGGWGWAALLAPAFVVLLGVVVGAVFSRTPTLRDAHWSVSVSVPAAAGVLAGLAFAGLGGLASGSIGPDRLEVAGVSVWLFAGIAAAELGAGMLLGVAAGRLDYARFQRPKRAPQEAAEETSAAGLGAAGLGAADSADTDDQLTVPLDEAVARVERQRAPVVPLVPDEPSEPADPSGDPADDPSDDPTDALVQAYSWDRRDADALAEEETPKKRGWRFPRREH